MSEYTERFTGEGRTSAQVTASSPGWERKKGSKFSHPQTKAESCHRNISSCLGIPFCGAFPPVFSLLLNKPVFYFQHLHHIFWTPSSRPPILQGSHQWLFFLRFPNVPNNILLKFSLLSVLCSGIFGNLKQFHFPSLPPIPFSCEVPTLALNSKCLLTSEL